MFTARFQDKMKNKADSIGLTGTNGAGKGEVASFFVEKGYAYFSLSDVIREEMQKENQQLTRNNMIRMGNVLRHQFSPDILARRVAKKIQGKVVESGKLQMLRKAVGKVIDFLRQRYIWLGLTIGFLWMLSAPVIITIFQGFLGDYVQEFTWVVQVVFFPLSLSSLIITHATAPGAWIIMYGFSFVISMFFCLSITCIIHIVRIRRQPSNFGETRGRKSARTIKAYILYN